MNRPFLARAWHALDARVGMGIARTCVYRLARPARPAVVQAKRPLTWRRLDAHELATLLAVGPFDLRQGEACLARGDLCYVAESEGRLAHFCWLQRQGTHLIEEAATRRPVISDEVWVYEVRTAEWARGLGIYPATLSRIAAEQFAEGSRAIWIYAAAGNVSSRRGIEKAGFELVEVLAALRTGQRYWPLTWLASRPRPPVG